jgi:uncharacterized SAM-binding protein YcdF (DUF218 family)
MRLPVPRILTGLGILAIALGLVVWLGARLGFLLQAPAASPVKADLIVALGGDGGARAVKAAELYRQGYAPRVLLTGVEGGDDWTRRHYLDWRAKYLIDEGVPRSALLFDDVSRSSWAEAVNTLGLMRREGWKRVLIVSDPPHLWRLEWVWHRLAPNAGVEYRLVASQPRWWHPGRWWADEQSESFVVSELIKITYYEVAHRRE